MKTEVRVYVVRREAVDYWKAAASRAQKDALVTQSIFASSFVSSPPKTPQVL